MKKCNICNEVKSLDCFHKNHLTADGYRYMCKKCASEYGKKYRNCIKQDYELYEKEKKRKREQSKKHGYSERYKGRYAKKHYALMKKYYKRFPEILAAHHKIQYMRINGYHLHHWNYNENHYTDVIKLSLKDHRKIHRHLNYDQKEKMYRISKTGILLDTKERHIEFINSIITNI